MNESDREREWKYAAGKDKSREQHERARRDFVRKANEDTAKAKNGLGLTTKDNEVLKKRQNRLSKQAARQRVRLQKPGIRIEDNAKQRARNEIPENRQKNNAICAANQKEKAVALQAEREVEFKANGAGRTTDFGLGEVSRVDSIECGAYNIMQNPAGVHPEGDGTITKQL